ncbi:hypothetical protein G3N56_16010 [Desulfovibrio sulfodismutans]|uniref:Uncharacterized protein n=1 Tax=Desulfolutivibrio sulfodismutans TaxID=63561 RepID=A0A7K3NPX7_9BACT|nr:hypothetical protein [Desulfolutivibrio sulfodismutans]NDY58238.1 hypothetical protein [Desulfolutivibrio sulfodismutans]QLA13089.1 hypothetical protein GD606_12835 [Desulfolutivibrio sulfodismutans DSM 3696]
MPERTALKRALEELLGAPLPGDPTGHVNDALDLAGRLEARGYGFRLRDARPKDPLANLWKAVFTKDGRAFENEDAEAALAVCRAALAALSD